MKDGLGSLGWLVWLGCLGCGGTTTKVEPASTAGASSTGGKASSGSGGAATTSAGATVTGGSAGAKASAGTDNAVDPATCQGAEPACIASCTSLDFRSSDCVGGNFRCPEGSVDFATCPANACARRSQSCCSLSGHVTVPECAADGSIGACPEGFHMQAETCLPAGIEIHDCTELMTGDSCPTEGMLCYTGRCSRNCSCDPDSTGALHWACSALPC